jgi:hypothetical protein
MRLNSANTLRARCLTYITTEIDPSVNHGVLHEELTRKYGSGIVPANIHLTDFFCAMGLKIRNGDLDVQMALQVSTAGRDNHDFEKKIQPDLCTPSRRLCGPVA